MEDRPAARAGDTHICSQVDGGKRHKGGPITEGCDTVLIEGMPAACLGHHAQCDGPEDTIVTASASVFFGGRPAARMGDSTAHGGIIIGGAATLFIGGGTTHRPATSHAPASHATHHHSHPKPKDPATKHLRPAGTRHTHLPAEAQAKKERQHARLQLISDGTAKAATMSESARGKVLKAARDFRKNMDAAEMAALSKDSYHYFDKGIKGPPVGYVRASENTKYLPKGITAEMLAPRKSQFRAEIYYPDKEIFGPDAQPIIAYKGTTPTNFNDLATDVRQSRGLNSDYYRKAGGGRGDVLEFLELVRHEAEESGRFYLLGRRICDRYQPPGILRHFCRRPFRARENIAFPSARRVCAPQCPRDVQTSSGNRRLRLLAGRDLAPDAMYKAIRRDGKWLLDWARTHLPNRTIRLSPLRSLRSFSGTYARLPHSTPAYPL